MEKKQKTKQQLKNLMINNDRYLLLLLIPLFYCGNKNKFQNTTDKSEELLKVNTIEIKNKLTTVGFFDFDSLPDTIFYILKTQEGEPLYHCNIHFGNGAKKELVIATGSGHIQLSNCKKGCIKKSEITTGIHSTETIEYYLYDENLNNWFIYEIIVIQGEHTKISTEFDEFWSIDDEVTKLKED